MPRESYDSEERSSPGDKAVRQVRFTRADDLRTKYLIKYKPGSRVGNQTFVLNLEQRKKRSDFVVSSEGSECIIRNEDKNKPGRCGSPVNEP